MTQRKTYRNALRSRRMLREAFISLLEEKPVKSITVVDVVQRADVSRNTFYAHYQDVYAILEELQDEAIAILNSALDQAIAQRIWQPEPLLRQIMQHVEEQRSVYRALFRSFAEESLAPALKQILTSRVLACASEIGVKDMKGFEIFMEMTSAGFISLVLQYLREESRFTAEEIVSHASRLSEAGMKLYLA